MVELYERGTHEEELEKIAVAADRFLQLITHIANSVSLPMSAYEEMMQAKFTLSSLLQMNGYDTAYNEYRSLTDEQIKELKNGRKDEITSNQDED